MQKTDFKNAVNRFEYTGNIMGRGKILLMQKHIFSTQKNRFDYCEIQPRNRIQIWCLYLENTISVAVL